MDPNNVNGILPQPHIYILVDQACNDDNTESGSKLDYMYMHVGVESIRSFT